MADGCDLAKEDRIIAAQYLHELNRPTVVCGGCQKVIYQAGVEVRFDTCYRCEGKSVAERLQAVVDGYDELLGEVPASKAA